MTDAHAAALQTSEDEPSIVRRIAAGDRSAFEILVRRYNRRLYRLARATLRNDAEAEDALQDAYIRAYRSIGQFRGDAALSTWLSRLVLNECLGRLRRDARRQNVVPLVSSSADKDLTESVAANTPLPEDSVGRAQVRSVLERKVDELPEAFRAVFILRSVEELSVEETAQCLDIPEATVRSRHFRAKGLLRESLARDVDLAERDLFDFGAEHCDRVTAKVLAAIQLD
jgi:RNA polymerase sigma factor (sigma-70 family)